MKKTGVILLSFFILFFGACSTHTPPVPQMDFTVSILIRQEDSLKERNSYQARLTSTSQGAVMLKVQSNDVLGNLQYTFEDKLTLSFGDMHLVTEINYLPSTSSSQAIYNVLFDLPRTGEFVGFEEDEAVFHGVTPGGEYRVKTDKEGRIEEISIEEINLSVDFDYE